MIDRETGREVPIGEDDLLITPYACTGCKGSGLPSGLEMTLGGPLQGVIDTIKGAEEHLFRLASAWGPLQIEVSSVTGPVFVCPDTGIAVYRSVCNAEYCFERDGWRQ